MMELVPLVREGLFVGVDIGTSGVKGALVDVEGKVQRRATTQHKTSHPAPGIFEHNAELQWWESCSQVFRELTDGIDEEILGVAVSGLGPCVLPTDDEGTPLRQAILYGIDTRSAEQIEALRRRLGPDHQASPRLSTQSVGPKLAWIERHEPDVWERTTRVFTSHSYVAFRLSGAYAIERTSASCWDPIYDHAVDAWDEELASEFFPRLKLPQMVDATTVVGSVTAAASTNTGIPEGTPVAMGVLDFLADVVGSGATAPGQALVIYGSTLLVNIVLDRRIEAPGFYVTPGATSGSYFLVGASATAGLLLNWVQTLLGGTSFDVLNDGAANVLPGSDGLLMLPYFAGERTPISDPDARGVFSGLDLHHGPAHLFRATLEGIGFGLKHMLDALPVGLPRPVSLTATGGGTASEVFLQIVSDITGLDQSVAGDVSGAAYGAALLAGLGTGVIDEAARWVATSQGTKIRASDGTVYPELYELYLQLSATSRPFNRLVNAAVGSVSQDR